MSVTIPKNIAQHMLIKKHLPINYDIKHITDSTGPHAGQSQTEKLRKLKAYINRDTSHLLPKLKPIAEFKKHQARQSLGKILAGQGKRRRKTKRRRKRRKKTRKKNIKATASHESYGRQGALQGGMKAGKTLKKRGGRHTKAKFMFNDGTAVYSKYDKKYNKHDKGYVILGPPGIGKTTFIRNQKGSKKDWIDQDDLFRDLGVKHHFNNKNKDDFRLNYLRADYMSEQTKLLGYRIIGALFWDYKADAIVIIPEKLHKQYLSKRKDLNLKTVMEITKYLREHAKKYNIPIFDNILDATKYLENLK